LIASNERKMKKEERKKSGVVPNETINFHIRQKK